MSETRITRADVEDTLRSFQGGVEEEIERRRQQVTIGIAVGAVVLLLLAYLFGKRRGRRRSTFVEIRRF